MLNEGTVVVGCEEPYRTIVLTSASQVKAWEKLGGEWSLLWEMEPLKAPAEYEMIHSPIPPEMAGKLIERFRDIHIPISSYFNHAIWWVPIVSAYVARAEWNGYEYKYDLYRPVFQHERECNVFVSDGERPPSIWRDQETTPVSDAVCEDGMIYKIWLWRPEPQEEEPESEEEVNLEELEELAGDENGNNTL